MNSTSDIAAYLEQCVRNETLPPWERRQIPPPEIAAKAYGQRHCRKCGDPVPSGVLRCEYCEARKTGKNHHMRTE